MHTLCKLPFFGVAEVSGADAAEFLHSQLSNHILDLQPGEACFATYNSPRGRVLANMLVLRRADRFLLVMAADLLEATIKRLRMFVLRSKTVFHTDSAWQVYGQSGADTGDLIRLEDKGKQPVTVQRQVKDAQGNVIGSEKIQTERNVFAIDVLERASVRQPENPIHFDKVPLPDEAVHLRSETEKLQKRAETPEQHAAADRAAADVETAVAEQRAQPDAGQSAGNMEAARNAYQQKATQLSAEAKSNLDAVHALIAKAAENMSDRQSADKIMLNFYRNAPDYMRGTDFELGKYLSSATQQTKTQQSSAPQQNDDMEIDR